MSEPTEYWCEQAWVGGRVRSGVSLHIVDGRFSAVDPDTEPGEGARRLAGFTIPGLANAHSHAFHRAIRSRTQGDRGSFWTWREQMYRAAGRLDPERYHALARAVFAEMVLAGITVVGEFHYVHHGVDGTPYQNPNTMGEALLAAADEAGVRITLLDTLYLHGGLADGSYGPLAEHQGRFCDGSVERWSERVDQLADTDRARVGAAIHSLRAVDPQAAGAVAAWAADRGTVVHAHVSEQPAENEQVTAAFGRSPTAILHDAGVLGPSFTAVHATHLTAADIGLLGGSTVCLCPTTERDLGDGIGPSPELVQAGARLALGSDSHAIVDLFEEARAVELDARLRSLDRGIHDAAELLVAATSAGHACLGWPDAGELAAGQRADLVTVSMDSVRTAGADDPVAATVFAATAADVTDVVIDGRPQVMDGRHVRIDVAAELALAIADVMGEGPRT